MVKLEFEGQTYRIRWRHSPGGFPAHSTKWEAARTDCSIWVGEAGEWRDDPQTFDLKNQYARPVSGGSVRFLGSPLITAQARCSDRDQFSRVRGRQISLGRVTIALFGRGPRREAFLRAVDGAK